jgi:uncharacterized protein (TIGR00270 family)
MIVCNNFAKLGRPLGPAVPAQGRVSPAQNALRTMTQRPIQPIDVEFDVDPEYYLKIRQAREKLGLSQEQLGQLLNEKPSVIKMVESRKLKPDLTLTRKFMHQLKINLLVSLSELEGGRPTGI